jgi:predicted ATPase
MLFGLVAEAYAVADQVREALSAVETGLAIAKTGQLFWNAELHRQKGELALATGGPPIEAEALFRRALEIARAQEARSFELRAAASLARLLPDQGRRAEARAELAPVYAWFTEGFDTPDLVEAKALLNDLS